MFRSKSCRTEEKQAKREGGHILTLSKNSAVGNTSHGSIISTSSLPTLGSRSNAETTEVNHGQIEGAAVTSGYSSETSDRKDITPVTTLQVLGSESLLTTANSTPITRWRVARHAVHAATSTTEPSA